MRPDVGLHGNQAGRQFREKRSGSRWKRVGSAAAWLQISWIPTRWETGDWKSIGKVFLYLTETVGKSDATKTKRADILKVMDANRHRIRFASYIQQKIIVLFEHAIDLGWMDHSPT